MRANHSFTLAARRVPVTVNVPAARKSDRCFVPAVELLHDAGSDVSVEVRREFIASSFPMGFKRNVTTIDLIPPGVYRLSE